MRQNERGFTVVEVLVVLVVLALVGGAGWFVYQRQNKNDEPKRTAVTNFEECKAAGYPVGESYPEQCFVDGQTFVNQSQKPQNEPGEPEENDSEYLEINEWGIKVKMRDADKLSYVLKNGLGNIGPDLVYDSWIVPAVKPDYLHDKECEIGLGLYRSPTKPENYVSQKIGDVYYVVTGGPGACSDDPENNSDDILKKRIIEDLSPKNIVQL